jgi:hypothetical protein
MEKRNDAAVIILYVCISARVCTLCGGVVWVGWEGGGVNASIDQMSHPRSPHSPHHARVSRCSRVLGPLIVQVGISIKT